MSYSDNIYAVKDKLDTVFVINVFFFTSKLTRTVTTSLSQGGNLAMILVMKEAMVSP